MSGELNKEIKRIAGLVQNKNASKANIEQQANLNIWKRQVKIADKFTSVDDKKLAEKLFSDYLANYEFESSNEINTLADLIFEEVLKHNLQTQINKSASDASNNYISDKTIKSLHDIETRVLHLKEILKINKSDEKENDLSALQQLEKRFSKYIEFNRHSFDFVCPDCGQPTLIRRRCGKKDFETLKHPFFCGRFYYNPRGMALVKAGIWTKEQYAWAFHTHADYVTWCIANEDKIPDIPEFTEEEIKEFVNKNPFLRKDEIPENILEEK